MPQFGQMILQWFSTIRSPQRSQVYTHSVVLGPAGGGASGRRGMGPACRRGVLEVNRAICALHGAAAVHWRR